MGGEEYSPSICSQNNIKMFAGVDPSVAELTSEVYSGSLCCFCAQLAFVLLDPADFSLIFCLSEDIFARTD
jgi:hypothetical protein